MPSLLCRSRRNVALIPALGAVLACLLLGCQDPELIDSQVAALYGGDPGIAALRFPDEVTAFRVESHVRDPDNPVAEDKLVAGHLRKSGPHDVAPDVARGLAEILSRENVYEWDLAKGCEFDPGVVVRFVKSEWTLDVVFCFSCDELRAHLNGKRLAGEDFDSARAELLAVMRDIFPDDAEIQDLK